MPGALDRKFHQIRATRACTTGHLARASLRDEAFRDIALVLPALRDHDLDARGWAALPAVRIHGENVRHVPSKARPGFPKKHRA